MSSWKEEYCAALKERDQRQMANYDIIDAYTRLADRASALEAEKAALQEHTTFPLGKIAGQGKNTDLDTYSEPANARLRRDLAEALRSKGQLELRLKAAEEELKTSRPKASDDTKRIRELTRERDGLTRRIKDKDAELKGKDKLLEEMQDDIMTIELEAKMAVKKSQQLKSENEELIARWMARMGEEADAMNNASKFS